MPVLGTKLHVPAPRRRLVARRRLTDQFDFGAGSRPRLVLVTAAAGFGKTTLMTQWLTRPRSRLRVAWLSLDSEDSGPDGSCAISSGPSRSPLRKWAAEGEALLGSDRNFSIQDVVVSRVNDLDSLPGLTVIALDDYHVIDSPEVHGAVSFLLENLPPQVVVAMTTPADPALPLARLRARGELLEIRAADLRFTEGGAGAFLNDIMGLELRPKSVAALGARTEGWASGLQLAALAARGRSRTEDSVEAFVLDYLLDEVLRNQPDAVHSFLLDTCVLDLMKGPLCDALTGRTDGQQRLEGLDRANVFVVPLDGQRIRYHHLFADAHPRPSGSSRSVSGYWLRAWNGAGRSLTTGQPGHVHTSAVPEVAQALTGAGCLVAFVPAEGPRPSSGTACGWLNDAEPRGRRLLAGYPTGRSSPGA